MARIRSIACLLLAAASPLAGATRAAPASPEPLETLLAAHGIRPVTPPAAAPDFRLPLVAGGREALSERLGDWVVLTFFATWCGPCRIEMPTLEQLHRSHGSAGVAVLAVSVDQRLEPVAPFARDLELTLPVFWDEGGEVGDAYGAVSIPVSYLIDPTGQVIGLARGARDWSAAAALFDRLAEALPAETVVASSYASLGTLELPEVLDPPTADWVLPAASPRPGRPFTLEVRLSWSGRLEDYVPQPPQLTLPDGISQGRVAASSSSRDRSHTVLYRIDLTAAAAGSYSLDPIELRYLPALGQGPVASQVTGPTIEVVPGGLGGRSALAAAGLVTLLAALAAAWGWRRRRRAGRTATETVPLYDRLRADLDRAKAARLAGDAATAYETLVAVAGEVEGADERPDLEQRLETVRFGGRLPDGGELEAVERRLERALAALRPDPEDDRRRRLRLRSRPGQARFTTKETPG